MGTNHVETARLSSQAGNHFSDSSHRHVVQFYGDDPSSLFDSLARFFGSALGTGGAAISITTPKHRELLSDWLHGLGLDLKVAEQQGRYLALDAEETLSSFMVGNMPDRERFLETIGGLIGKAKSAAGGPHLPIAVFGEMVAILWEKGNAEAAIITELLWNEIAKIHQFSLYCAYPISGFSREQDSDPLRHICQLHTQVLPGEEYTKAETEDQRHQTVVLLQQKAEALKTEVVERKRVQLALAQHQDELTDLLENAPQAVQQIGPDLQIMWANKALLTLLGYEADEYIGQPAGKFCVDEQAFYEFWKSLERVEDIIDSPVQLRRKDGSICQVLVRSSGVWNGSELVRTRCFIQDISSRKSEEEMRSRLAAIVESSDDAIVSKDLNSIVTSWNSSAERLFGYTAAEMIGRSIRTIIPPELIEEEDLILDKIRRGERLEHFETVRVTKSGSRVNVSLTVSPVLSPDGKVIGAAKIARDITKQKKMEEMLLVSEKLASVGRLAATVAHEINNPLEAITNLVYLANSQIENPQIAKKYLSMAQEELRRVSFITHQTLGFYREQHGARQVCLQEILQQLIEMFTPRARAKGIEFRLEVRSDPRIWAVAGELRQLLANLLNNSIDASRNKATIRIRVSNGCSWGKTTRKGVRITIADSGPGIPREYRRKIFEPFFTTKQDVGTGLGLWICRSIISTLSGIMQLKSSTKPGKSGTAFSIFLPLGTNLQKQSDGLRLAS